MCLDFRKLNEATIPDNFPLPRIDAILEKVGGTNYFSSLDMANGYLKLSLDPSPAYKCGFITESKVYAYTHLPFGRKSAASYFQQALRQVSRGLEEEILNGLAVDQEAVEMIPAGRGAVHSNHTPVLREPANYDAYTNDKKTEEVETHPPPAQIDFTDLPAGAIITCEQLTSGRTTLTEHCRSTGPATEHRTRDGRRWWAVPLFAETVADDRPDLHMVILDVFANDLRNGDRIDINDSLFGEIVLITSFMALPNTRLADIVSTFDNIHRTESHRFLAVKEFYLLKREFSETQVIQIPLRALRVNVFCVARGQTLHVTARTNLFTAKGIKKMNLERKPLPLFSTRNYVHPGQFLKSILEDDNATILQRTNGHLTSDSTPPSVVTIKHLSRRDAEYFDAMPQPFQRFNGDKGKALAALVECAFVGFTGILATANKNREGLRNHRYNLHTTPSKTRHTFHTVRAKRSVTVSFLAKRHTTSRIWCRLLGEIGSRSCSHERTLRF
uniref:Reverse transcriptase domain-containing protein n=1 Tax=Caenorhabditis japonica TaxID=281687 RepID=A0A8R1DLA6_CAEJA